MLTCALGQHEIAKQDAATTAQVQQVLAHAASLTTEQALVEGGKKDATPGWRLTSALYNSKKQAVCYTYKGNGQGISYEYADMNSRTWIVYHSDGLEEFSNGRSDFWEAGDNPCEMRKRWWKDDKNKVVDLLLTPAENICMDKVDTMQDRTDRQVAARQAAIYACFGEPVPSDVQAVLNKPAPKPSKSVPQNNCPLEPPDGYYCNGTTQVPLPYTKAAQSK